MRRGKRRRGGEGREGEGGEGGNERKPLKREAEVDAVDCTLKR